MFDDVLVDDTDDREQSADVGDLSSSEDTCDDNLNHSQNQVNEPTDDVNSDQLPVSNTYQLRNRDKIQPLARYQVNVTEFEEPATYKEALKCKDNEKWKLAIEEELAAHQKNNTWSIVKKPANCYPIDSKWVYKGSP